MYHDVSKCSTMCLHTGDIRATKWGVFSAGAKLIGHACFCMFKNLNFLPLFAVFLVFVSCAATQEKRNEAVSRGVYAVHDSLERGRPELAKSYSRELTKIVPAPKDRIPVAPVAPSTPKEAKKEAKELEGYSEDVEKLKSETIQKAQEPKQTLWGSFAQTWGALKFLTGFGGLAIAVGLVVFFIFVPGALPIVLNILGIVWTVLKRIGSFTSSATLKLLDWVRGRVGK